MADTLSVADALERAADLIEPEGAWTQGALYRDALGEPAGAASGKAVCWCAVGALNEVRGPFSDAFEAVEALLPKPRTFHLRPLSDWNDAPGRTQAEVVAKLREAAALAREQGK